MDTTEALTIAKNAIEVVSNSKIDKVLADCFIAEIRQFAFDMYRELDSMLDMDDKEAIRYACWMQGVQEMCDGAIRIIERHSHDFKAEQQKKTPYELFMEAGKKEND